jgi:hypothetical protein
MTDEGFARARSFFARYERGTCLIVLRSALIGGHGMVRKALAAFVLVGCLCACGAQKPASDETAICPGLVKYDPARARQDATDALERNDRHLMGVYGYTPYVPGMESSDGAPPAPSNERIEWMEGTSDAPRCPAMSDRALRYARSYNSVILADRRGRN